MSEPTIANTTLAGNILTEQGWVSGSIEFGQRIHAIRGSPCNPQQDDQPYILPGFIDLHVHGGGGKDVMQGGLAVKTIAQLHAQYGTTSFLATTMTAPLAEIEDALRGIQNVMQHMERSGARLLGVHLEGPYISAHKLGAQPDFTQPASLIDIKKLNAIAPIKLITIAPEIAENLALIPELLKLGMKVQLGHTEASYEQSVDALRQGAGGFTHLFNAMSHLHHRAPGVVGAALAHASFAEIIPDLLHVHPGAIRAALRAIPYLYCVTDSTAASGMPDGEYLLGRQSVHKCLGGVRLEDGTLAGSVLTMDQALRNLVNIGLDLSDAAKRVSTFAADYLGIADRGRIKEQCYADVVVLDRQLNVIDVYVEGQKVVRSI